MNEKVLIEEVLRLDDLSQALWLAEIVGETLSKNTLSTFSSPEIEDHVFSLFIKNKSLSSVENNSQDVDKVAFIITEPYNTGGHTRLMERLSGYLNCPVDLVITRNVSSGVYQRLSPHFENIYLCPEKSVVNRLLSIFEVIKNYTRLVLFIHPNDIVTVTACRILKKTNSNTEVFFVNHADHVFNYGVSVADYWFQLSAYGDAVDKLRNGLTGLKTFIGIPVPFPKNRVIPKPINDGDVSLVISSGDSYKFKTKKEGSIIPLLRRFLEMDSHPSIYIIGVNVIRDYWWWGLKLRYLKRLKLINKLPYEEFLDVTSRADVYIDSHPIPGGTTFVEQYLQGRYCVGLTTNLYGYSPVEYVKYNTVDEVFENRIFNRCEDESEIYEMIKNVNSPQEVSARFLGTLNDGIVYENLNVKYAPTENVRQMVFGERLEYISPELLLFCIRRKNVLCYIFSYSTVVGILFVTARLIKRLAFNKILKRG